MSSSDHSAEQDPCTALTQFVETEVARMLAIEVFLREEAIPVVTDLEEVNHRLTQAGRHDLAITLPAAMAEFTDPATLDENVNNFVPKFQIITGRLEHKVIRQVTEDYSYEDKVTELIPVSENELIELGRGARSFKIELNHARKPAYQRMLVLFPEFTIALTLDFSQKGYTKLYKRYAPELFAAYQIMSRLVDQEDEHVIRDGEVDDWYLCR